MWTFQIVTILKCQFPWHPEMCILALHLFSNTVPGTGATLGSRQGETWPWAYSLEELTLIFLTSPAALPSLHGKRDQQHLLTRSPHLPAVAEGFLNPTFHAKMAQKPCPRAKWAHLLVLLSRENCTVGVGNPRSQWCPRCPRRVREPGYSKKKKKKKKQGGL